MNEITSALEAILFAAGEPVPIARISLSLGLEEQAVLDSADDLNKVYEKNRHSLRVLTLNRQLQLCTVPEYASFIMKALEHRKPPMLSQPAIETLAIIAYFQPATTAYISKIRGVDSNYSISSLLEKGLIEATGRLDAPGRPTLYGTTSLFLRSMGLKDLNELPALPDLSSTEGIQQLQEAIQALQVPDTEGSEKIQNLPGQMTIEETLFPDASSPKEG